MQDHHVIPVPARSRSALERHAQTVIQVVIAAMLIGAWTQMTTQSHELAQLSAYSEGMRENLIDVKQRLASLETQLISRTDDRWRASEQKLYAAEIDRRLEIIAGQISGLERRQARILLKLGMPRE